MFEKKFIEIYEKIKKWNINRMLGIKYPEEINYDEWIYIISILRKDLFVMNASKDGRSEFKYKIINELILNSLYASDQKANNVINEFKKELFLKMRNFPLFINESDKKFETKYNIFKIKNYFLTPEQIKLYESIEFDKQNYIITANTSFGKSFIVKLKILEELNRYVKNILIILPTKSLISEYVDWFAGVKTQFEKSINLVTNKFEKIDLEVSNLIIATQETALYLISENKFKISNAIFDEFYDFNPNKTRFQVMFVLINYLNNNNNNAKFMFLSPNLQGLEKCIKKINEDIFQSIIIKNINFSLGTRNFVNINTSKNTIEVFDNISKKNEIILNHKNFKESNVEFMIDIIKNVNKISKNENFIIFSTSTKIYEHLRDFMNKFEQNLYTSDTRLKNLCHFVSGYYGEKYDLTKSLEKGIALHKGQIDQFTRFFIEKLFKDKIIKYLFCTTTLTKGVNLNSKFLFMLSSITFNKGLNKIETMNLIGRIGRVDKNPHGYGFYIAAKKNNILLDILKEKDIEVDIREVKNDNFIKKIESDSSIEKNKNIFKNKDNNNFVVSYEDYYIDFVPDNNFFKIFNDNLKEIKEEIEIIYLKDDFNFDSYRKASESLIKNIKLLYSKDWKEYDIELYSLIFVMWTKGESVRKIYEKYLQKNSWRDKIYSIEKIIDIISEKIDYEIKYCILNLIKKIYKEENEDLIIKVNNSTNNKKIAVLNEIGIPKILSNFFLDEKFDKCFDEKNQNIKNSLIKNLNIKDAKESLIKEFIENV